ncbi:helix-turn-helix domain-containing protein [Paenibacillus allorhizosphaerae]|uniref:HTH-type transcriptional activator RhaR n=1 Tax=Paenibacillus allorhizosphaerae TaxID=2849866 RepID=A0ABM8VUS5_9BACL|nr:AraC family transcriptional regulator [Paenibacillus allorhizosphaerae]CAG7659085.1 HTH-type transcriptional activator RhaR [Paenibacillus allorhizosphaerae]
MLEPTDIGAAVPVGKIRMTNSAPLLFTLARMKKIALGRDAFTKHKLNHHVLDIWYLYCEEISITDESTDAVANHSVMGKAQQTLKKLAFESFQLREVAASLGLSPSRFSKGYKTAYGETPIQFVTGLRLEKVKKLLAETKMTLDQISECCGYQNGFYLNRVFTKNVGITPLHYRKMHRV